jgi:hypothetical protein
VAGAGLQRAAEVYSFTECCVPVQQ